MPTDTYLCASCENSAETVRTDDRLQDLIAQREVIGLTSRHIRVPLCQGCAADLDAYLATDDGWRPLNDDIRDGAELDNFILALSPQPILDASGHASPPR